MAPLIIHRFLLTLLTLVGTSSDIPQEKVDIHKVVPQPISQSSSMCDCTVSQGENIYNFPFFSSDESAIDFYAYGVPTGSSSNTGLETSNGMIMLLYEDTTTGETSLIIILDATNDGSGGDVNISFNCLPSNAFVALSDDGGELSGTPPNIIGNFSWASCCTDGGIIGGIGCGNTFTINPDIGSGIDVFTLVSGNPEFPEYINLEEIDCPITINCGGTTCCEEAFEIESTIQNATCITSSDGLIDLNTTCSSSPSFIWSNGSTSEDLFDIPPGTYTVTVTDDGGCMLTETFNVGNDVEDPEPIIEGPTVFCLGSDNSISLSVDSPYDTYNWSTGDDDQTIQVYGEGTYDVTVTNSFGCIGSGTITIVEENSPEPEIMGPVETCQGEGILLDAGAGYSSYNWSNGVTNQIIYADQETTYSVTVTNAVGCTGTASTSITVNPNPLPFILGQQDLCEGDTIMLDAEDGFESYLWNTGEESQVIQVSESGFYEVSVTNVYGCIGVDIVFIDLIEPPLPIINGAISFCKDSIVSLSTEGEYTMYEWSTGAISDSISISEAGIYTITVTNDDGCIGIAQHEIIQSSSDTTETFLSSCNPLDTGTFITPYENEFGCENLDIVHIDYVLSDSVYVFNQSCNPLDTGTIVHHGTNQFGCDSMTFETTTLLSSHIIFIEEGSCMPEDTGIVTQNLINQFGCDSIVTTHTLFLLSDTTYQDAFTCDPLNVGITEELQTGENGCDSLIIVNTSLLELDTTYLDEATCDQMFVGVSETVEIGENGCDSLIIINTYLMPSDTTVVQDFTCDPTSAGITEEVFNSSLGCDSIVITQIDILQSDSTWIMYETCLVSDSGLVIVSLTNQFGCDSLIYNFTELLPEEECILHLNVLADTISCQESLGSVWLTLLNGTPPFYYEWTHQNGSSGSGDFEELAGATEIPSLPSGSISFYIEDSGGMTFSFDVIIYQPDDIEIELNVGSNYNSYDISCFKGSDGMVAVENIHGGLPPYSYNWSTGSQSSELTSLTEGWYRITVTDAIGCQHIDSILLSSPDELFFELEVMNGDCFTNGNGTASIEEINGGVAPYLFSLDQMSWQTNSIYEDLQPGNHTIEIEDANGCLITTNFNISEYVEPSIDLGLDIEISLGESIEISASSTIDLEAYETIYWEGFDCPGCKSITVSPEISTAYTIIAIDSLGCEIADEIIINVLYPNTIYLPNVFSPDFDGVNDYFTVFSNNFGATILKLQVYDRWGEQVYSKSNFPANNPSLGWDGTHRGQRVSNGVYLYLISIEYEDGKTEFLNGDILVLR